MPRGTAVEYLYFILLLVASVGYGLLLRAIMNRAFRIAVPLRVWSFICAAHVAVGVAVPFVMLERLGLHGARLLRGGQWARVAHPWRAYAVGCIAYLVAAAVAPLFQRKAAALVAERARRFDAAPGPSVHSDERTEAGSPGRPLGTRILGAVARFPGNEQLQFELSERELHLPSLPPQLDGLSILHLSDLHLNGSHGTPPRAFFERAITAARELAADLVVLTGDVMDHHQRADWLPTTLGKLSAPLGCWFILGNHDAYDDPDRIRNALTGIGWIDVGGRSVAREMHGAEVLISGTEAPWLGSHPPAPHVQGLDPLRSNGDRVARPFRMLLSHTPDHFRWASRRGFDLVLAGHLHGGQIRLPALGPICGGRFNAGVFERPQPRSAGATVMHVSRGLGAIFPLRWGSRPEVTKLVLRSSRVSAVGPLPPGHLDVRPSLPMPT